MKPRRRRKETIRSVERGVTRPEAEENSLQDKPGLLQDQRRPKPTANEYRAHPTTSENLKRGIAKGKRCWKGNRVEKQHYTGSDKTFWREGRFA